MPDKPAPHDVEADLDLGQDRPHSARMYDYYLGGKTNYAVDREAARAVIAAWPGMTSAARANRAYMHRAVELIARRGVRQFLDIGTGIPTSPNLHQVVQQVAPECRVVYVDNDPIVLTYADWLLKGSREGRTGYVHADVNRPEQVLARVEAEGILDFDRPVGLTLHAVMHFVSDPREAYGVVDLLMGRLAPGSFLSLSHCTADFAPEEFRGLVDTYAQGGTQVRPRTRAEVERFFEGLELVEPGVVVAHRWRPEPASGPSLVGNAAVSVYAGVARKP